MLIYPSGIIIFRNKDIKMAIKKKDGFMLQAAILAAAGLISRVIGLLYAVPLYQIIGEEGNGYYGTAYDIYFMILLISTYSIPVAISKVISERLALEQYKNAKRLFICSLVYVLIVGSVTALITFIFAPKLVIEPAVLSLRVMAPTIFFSGLLSVFRGYMQAHNTMVPTAISQIIEQIINAIVSVSAAYIFTIPFRGIEEQASTMASHGAAGSALGTGAGVLAGLIFILLTYLGRRKEINEKVVNDTSGKEEKYSELFKVIILMVTPIILSTFIYNVSTTIDMKIYWWIIELRGVATDAASKIYGIYSRQFIVLINLPIAISSAVSSALIPGVSGEFSKGNNEAVREKINHAIRVTMLVVVPATVGMFSLANPIMQLLFNGTTKTAGYALMAGAVSIVFYSLSTITNGILQGVGKVTVPVKNAAIALVIHVLFVFGFLYFTNGTIYVLVAGSVVYSFVMCVLNGISIKKYLGYKMDSKKIFLMPTISAIIMGVIAFFVYMGVSLVTHSNTVSLIVAILIAIIVYALLIIRIGGYSEEELLDLPKGALIVKIAKKIHLMK